jgi:hypothetical protein
MAMFTHDAEKPRTRGISVSNFPENGQKRESSNVRRAMCPLTLARCRFVRWSLTPPQEKDFYETASVDEAEAVLELPENPSVCHPDSV